MSEKLCDLKKSGSSGGSASVSEINRLIFMGRSNGNYIMGQVYVDCTKFSKLEFTLGMSGANFTGGFLNMYNSSGTGVQSLTTTAGAKSVDLNSNWGASAYLYVYARASAEYGKITLSGITLTSR